jgi:hypothetical protein
MGRADVQEWNREENKMGKSPGKELRGLETV